LFSEETDWSAYHFVLMLGLKTCPYCNRQYITPAYHEKDGCVRADLDHFYPKSKYPYLSMSIYNLVPCCKFCNSSLKHDKNFSYEEYLNPYERGFGNLLKFSYRAKSYDLSENDQDNIEIYLSKNKNLTTEEEEILKKAEKTAKIFKIESLYNYHRWEVSDLIRKRIVYSSEYIKEIKERLEAISGKKVENDEVIAFILSHFIQDEKLHEKPLAKLYKDIAEELEFISTPVDLTEDERNRLIKFVEGSSLR